MTPRQEVEAMFGIAKPARVRQAYPMINRETPTHWRKTLRVWAKIALGLVVGGFALGLIAGLAGRVWP
jgi:hypothetical protein